MSNEDVKLEYMHLCDYAAPGQSGKINLMGIFDFFIKPTEPKVFDFYIAARIFVKTKKQYKVSFEIKFGDNKVFVDEKQVNAENYPGTEFNILKYMRGIEFKNLGVHKFVVLVDDLPIGYKEVEVKPSEITGN